MLTLGFEGGSIRNCLVSELAGEPEGFLIQQRTTFEVRSSATDRHEGAARLTPVKTEPIGRGQRALLDQKEPGAAPDHLPNSF